MDKSIVKNAITRLIENADDQSLRQIFNLINDFSQCPEHGKGRICEEVSRIAAEYTEEEIPVISPPKYRGKHEELVERIAQEEREDSYMEMMRAAQLLEKLRGC